MNQEFHFKTQIPSKTFWKIGRHQIAKKYFGRHLTIPGWQLEMDLIHPRQPKS
jgi:hypothetical protein